MTPLVLTLPMPPTLSNSGKGRSRHWRVLEKEKTLYWAQLQMLVVARLIPPPPHHPISRATITSHMVLGGAMDDDNAMSRHKWAIDFLVQAGYLVTDRRTCLRWTALPTQEVTRKKPASITLTLTPLDLEES